jgi:hypothetical protein
MNDYVDTLPTILDDKKIQKIDDCKLYYVYKKLLNDFNMNINIFKDELIRRKIPFDDDDTGYDLKNVIINMIDTL